jgi:membrane protein DedA with SNARE-associated domain
MFDWITGLMNGLGYAGIALLMFLENIFPPIPSEVVMPLAGFTATQGGMSLVGVIAAGSLGSLAGAIPWYYAGRIYGHKRMREFADRYGRWITVSPEDIDHATEWFNRHGRSAVLIGRLVPGVRTLISVPAGISGMGLFPFLLYSTIGTVAWTSLLAICGYILRDQWSAVESYISPISTVLIVVLVLWFASRYVRQWRGRRRQKQEMSQQAGE